MEKEFIFEIWERHTLPKYKHIRYFIETNTPLHDVERYIAAFQHIHWNLPHSIMICDCILEEQILACWNYLFPDDDTTIVIEASLKAEERELYLKSNTTILFGNIPQISKDGEIELYTNWETAKRNIVEPVLANLSSELRKIMLSVDRDILLGHLPYLSDFKNTSEAAILQEIISSNKIPSYKNFANEDIGNIPVVHGTCLDIQKLIHQQKFA